jgi:tripartite-type tricarboxylate transporter receptor subunit TctC
MARMTAQSLRRLGTGHTTWAHQILALLLGSFCMQAWAQSYPTHPVQIIVPLSTGSATDGLMRIMAQQLGNLWGQSVIVVNRPGAAGTIGSGYVAKADPDGYTLLAMSTNQVIGASLYSNLPFSMQHDLQPIVRMGSVPLVLCVNPALPTQSVNELIALARAKPRTYTFGSPGKGTTAHLAGELFAQQAGIKLVHVPYSKVSQAQTDLAAGQLSMMFVIPVVARQLSDNHLARCLVTNSLAELPQFPGLPTMKEAGLHDFAVSDWFGLVGPTGLPPVVIQKISNDVLSVMRDPSTLQKIIALGVVPRPLGATEFAPYYEQDFPRWAALLKTFGISAEQD